MDDICTAPFEHIIVIAFLHNVACIEEIDVISGRQSAAGEDAVTVFGNIGIKNDALIFPGEKISAYIVTPAAHTFAVGRAR